MIRELFLIILLFFCIGIVSGQSDMEKAHSYIQRAEFLLEAESFSDSIDSYMATALTIYVPSNEWEIAKDNFLRVALACYQKRFVEEGIQLLQSLDEAMTASLDEPDTLQIEVRYQMARGYYFTGNLEQCKVQVENNMSYIHNESLLYADHSNLLGVIYYQNGNLLAAQKYLKTTLAIRQKKLDSKSNQIASVLNNIGNIYKDLGLYNKAVDYYNHAIEIRQELLSENHPSIAVVLFNSADLLNKKGDYNQAIIYFQKAYDIFQKDPESYADYIAEIFNNLAVVYKNKGSFQESNAYHQQAIQKYQSLPDDYSVEIGNVYANWSNLSVLQGKYDLSVQQQQQALEFYKKTLEGTHPRVIAATNNLGVAYADSGDYEGALAELLSLVPLIENDEEQRDQYANLNNDIADIYFKIDKIAEAKIYNEKALAIQQELFGNKSYKLAYTYNNLAKIAEAEGSVEQALQYLQEALAANHTDFEAAYVNAAPPPQGFYKFDYFIESLMHKARLMRVDGDASTLLQANLLYQVADSVIAEVRDELLAKDDKIRMAEKTFALSQAAIENYVQLSKITGDSRYLEEAFRFSEKSKNSVLAQSIQANQAKQFAGIPDSLLVLEDQLQSDINFYNLKLAEQPDSLERTLFQNELFAAQQAYRALVETLETDYPFYYQLKYDRTLPRVQALQFSLPEKTAMLSYFAGDSILYCFVITQNDFQVHRSLVGKEFYDQQVGLRKSIIQKLNEDYIVLAHELYQTLFPFELVRDIESLIIIPDGTLSKLPFETLLSRRTNPRGNINFSKLPYLVNDYQINYELSATMYYQEQATMSILDASGEGLLAYAPVFAEPQEMAFYASQLRDPIADLEADAQRTITLDGRIINALPATASEVQAIAKVFQDKGQKVTTYLFKDASENQLKRSDLSQSRYIHIATHGFINEDQPDLSGLLLFPDTTGREDHILYSGEVYNLNLKAELVVLSACETGLGKVASGEGLLGLSRAFRYAGAENLIVSLWKVQDRATADLMTDFYMNHLDEGQGNFASPLRQAKLKMINTSRSAHPYYWSAFVLIGQ